MLPTTPWKIKPMSEHLSELEELPELEPLWGPFLYPGTVTLLIGESSVGKTVLIYRLCQALATGQTFLGLTPPHPLKVLHVDIETPPLLQRKHLRIITPPPGWDIWDGPFKLDNVPETHQVIVVDSLMLASPTKDENDNSEANMQIMPYLALARRTKASVILVHNSGKSSQREKFHARGASSRIDRVDVAVNVTHIIGGRRIKIVKSRYDGLESYIDYTFGEELSYVVTKDMNESPQPSVPNELEKKVYDVISAKLPTHLQFIFDILQANTDALHKRVERALTSLIKQKKIYRHERGYYLRVVGKTSS